MPALLALQARERLGGGPQDLDVSRRARRSEEHLLHPHAALVDALLARTCDLDIHDVPEGWIGKLPPLPRLPRVEDAEVLGGGGAKGGMVGVVGLHDDLARLIAPAGAARDLSQ